jgi:hypothetical protein
MRYARDEVPVAPAILPATGTARVWVLDQITNTLLNLTTDQAVMTVLPADQEGNTLWQWPLTNIVDIDQITYAQLVIAFEHDSGVRDYVKMQVRGILDEISRIRRLVSATL